jgi:hypothetical protein
MMSFTGRFREPSFRIRNSVDFITKVDKENYFSCMQFGKRKDLYNSNHNVSRENGDKTSREEN